MYIPILTFFAAGLQSLRAQFLAVVVEKHCVIKTDEPGCYMDGGVSLGVGHLHDLCEELCPLVSLTHQGEYVGVSTGSCQMNQCILLHGGKG